jgi:hypothetical protein
MSENKLVKAYNNMLTSLHEDIGDASKTLARGLDAAREKASEIGGLTQEEVHKVADYVQRDIEEAAHALAADDNEIDKEAYSEWLKFDIQLLENFTLDAFMNIADKTRLELAKLEQRAKANNIYYAGEICSPGTLACTECHTEVNVTSPRAIPECHHCGAKTFQRC